jgi:hypothetical protein
MKKTVAILITLFFFWGLCSGCQNSPKQEQENETPIGVRKQHDTRVVIVCKTDQGQYTEKSLHYSESVTCGDSTYKLKDFARLNDTDRYIPFPGREQELENYLNKAKK